MAAGDDKGRCVRCREWQEHYYWEHMNVSKMKFFKIMTADFQRRISIPEKITSNFTGQNAKGGFTLKAPSGDTCHVGAERIANELFFMYGWEEFAKAHELQENDLLVFEFSGNGSFDVLIFDSSGSEKVSSFFADKNGTNMPKQFDDIVGQQDEGHCLMSHSDKAIMPLSQLVGNPDHKASTSKKPRKEVESPNNSDSQVKGGVDDEEEESDDEHTNSNDYCYSRFASYLNVDEQEQIFGLASIQPGNPIYVVVLQESHVRRANNILIIPSKFAADHLEGRSHEMLLLRPNRREKWHVKYYHASFTRGFNCRRWANFIRDNRLREGHVCIFEVMKGTREATMTVHVFQKVKDRFVLLG